MSAKWVATVTGFCDRGLLAELDRGKDGGMATACRVSIVCGADIAV